MSLQLILGNSGSGKSRQLYKNMITASVQSPGTRFLVIVPEQFTMQTQKELVRLHPRKGIFNIDILSFERLAHRIFEEVGADRRTVLEEIGKTLLLRRAALRHQDELQVLKGSLKKKGCLAEVKSLISELTQYDIDQEKMEKLLEAAKNRPRLSCKLQDIQILYHAFEEELEGKYITAEETLEALCQVAGQSEILKNSVIALDGFTGFTPIQQKLMKKLLMLAKEVWVTVTIDAGEDFFRIRGEHELFYLSKKTIRSLSAAAKETDCEILPPMVLGGEEMPRFAKSRELAFLERHLFRAGGSSLAGKGEMRDISLHMAANPAMECRYAGRTIRSLIRNGYRYQDMAVIVGNMEAYAEYLPHIFAEYEIPVFLDQRRTVASNPLVEFIRAALELIRQDFTRDGVFRLLRTGLCGFSMEQVDLLENYVLAAGIRGYGMWKRTFERKPEGLEPEELEACEEMRKSLMEALQPAWEILHLTKTGAREKTAALYELVCHYEIQNQLAKSEQEFRRKGQMELQKEYSQIYRMVMELFDKAAELLGEERISLKEYAQILETGFEEMKVGMIPPSADQVQVGDLKRTRMKDIKILFFLGLNDGWVPSGSGEGGLLSEMERELLQGSGIELAPTAREESYIQRFYLYLNLTKPSEKLYLSYCGGDSQGEALRPSYLVRTIQKFFPGLTIQKETPGRNILGEAVTERTGWNALVDGLGNARDGKASPIWMELYNWCRGSEKGKQKAERLVQAAFLTFSEKGIGREAARELYGEILSNSVSRLERFSACAFSHFLQYGLHLQERQEYAIHPVDIGTILHRVMELFSRRTELEEGGWEAVSEERRDSLAKECLKEAVEEYGGEIFDDSARNGYQLRRLERIAQRAVWALQKQILAGAFRPVNYEVAFSQVEGLESVNMDLGESRKMKLQGRIDRIDVCEKEDQVYVKVVDYKSGSQSFDLNALYYGLQLQLVVYLSAAMELEKRIYRNREMVPAGLFYYQVKDPILTGSGMESPEQLEEKLLRELRPDGLVNGDPAVYREMDQKLSGASGVIPVTEKRDGTLDARSRAVSREQFAQMADFVQKKMQEIGRRMLEGEAAPVPCERGTWSACGYCPYGSVCRLDPKLPGTSIRRLREYPAEELWTLLGRMERERNGNQMDEGTADRH